MIKLRRDEIQSAIQEKLSRSAHEQIGAANDFRDFHCGIVRDTRKLIRRNIIRTPDDEIAEVFSRDELLRAEMAVEK